MATEAQILALLTGKKVFAGGTWRAYDVDDIELADPDGVLRRGVHGALLWHAAPAPADLSSLLALLTGKKVFENGTWRVYDAGGTELAHSGGVLWRGVHGALLWNVNRVRNSLVPIFTRRRRRGR